jgi:hypothetical protein
LLACAPRFELTFPDCQRVLPIEQNSLTLPFFQLLDYCTNSFNLLMGVTCDTLNEIDFSLKGVQGVTNEILAPEAPQKFAILGRTKVPSHPDFR